MTYQEFQQQMPHQNPQLSGIMNYGQSFGGLGIQSMGYGPGQAAYGHPYGQFGQFGAGAWGQRHLSQQDVGEVVRQLVPMLPQMLAQAQQPLAAYGYGGGYGASMQGPRMLTQNDVNEVVRQILPIVPQIVGALQGQWPHQGPHQPAAMYGGIGYGGIGGHGGLSPIGQSFGQPFQTQPFGQFPIANMGQMGLPPFQSAYGGAQGWGQQRHLTQQDVGEVVRQLTAAIPQVISNLQAFNQQRAI